ncbi:acyl carrier protein [Paenibacillus sp. SYP-B4298]|uniref:acyl carrier protein n=1 Tax=Paenibacillus sp. SYP-B4298 TaxID=2996034 RepID=UPI0022DE0EA9|nr:phosphopantetheine-binding protein [Paenibacillus sp. SYP-B4298]
MDKCVERLRMIVDEMFQENRGIGCQELLLTDRLREDLNMDSFDMAELTVRVENEFGVDIFEGTIVRTIQEVVDKLQVKLANE